jgi:hypothetical protein
MRLSATTAKWIALALLGLAISAGVAVAAGNLVSRQIGIASESVSAGDELAPAVETVTRQKGDRGGGSRNAAATADDDDAGPDSGGGETDDGAPALGEDELDDRIDAEEDARDEAEDAAEDRADELEDLADDNSGKGSDD